MGQEVPGPYGRYGTGTNEGRNLGSKSEQLFLREIREIDLRVLWDIERVVHTPEVTTRDEEGGGDTETSGESDLNVGSLSPKVRAICLVRADQRPTATL